MKPNIRDAENLLRELEKMNKKVPTRYAHKTVYIKSTARNIKTLKDFMKNDWTWGMLIRNLDKNGGK